jgi:toxin ParE1/3/4
MKSRRRWIVRLTESAATDFKDILRWTASRFGAAQARVYAETLSRAMVALTEGPRLAGTRPRNDIGRGIVVLHVARGGRNGRHFLICRATARTDPPTVDILRLLHDSMDLRRHVPAPQPDSDGAT